MTGPDDDDEEDFEPPESVEVPIDGVLDLHTFSPKDVADVVATYLDACQEKGVLSVRIIHGKGLGVQRANVEKVLKSHPAVREFHLADESAGGWGATLADLKPLQRG